MRFIISGLLLLVLFTLGSSCASSPGVTDPDAQQLFIGENIAVAPTAYGKVKGYVLRDIYHFMGIPYGANTSEKNRFMPPCPPEPWEGVLPCVYFPTSAPQII
ncbi:MAG TPA: carboxylesterase, partial [Rikenellaceae bacterium]|nr:carboxylesterase [Rikenellaceae bacterium]